MKKLFLALALLLAFRAPALAQTASPSHVQAAEELLGIMNVQKTMNDGVELMLRQQIQQNPEMARVEDIMREFMTKALNWEQLKPEFIRLYTDAYSEADLRGLIAFYQTPLGQKVLATLPQVMARSNEINQRQLQRYLPEMMQRMMERYSAPQPSKSKS